MLKTYVIRPGFTFAMPDGTVRGGGEEIELPSDVAALNAGAVVLKAELAPEEPAPEVDAPRAD